MTKAIKGFDHDFTCRGFQYEVGKTYKHEGAVRICETGFHACPPDIPFAVWDYYPPVGDNGELRRYAEVTLGDASQEDNKLVSASLTVDVELTLTEFVQRSIDALKALGKDATTGDGSAAATTGNYSAAATTGYRSAAATTGYRSAAATTGEQSTAMAAGDRSKVKARSGGLFAQEWRDGEIISNACGIVGQKGIKPDTWYICKDGKLVEVE